MKRLAILTLICIGLIPTGTIHAQHGPNEPPKPNPDISFTAVATNSTCAANGSIKVKLKGADAADVANGEIINGDLQRITISTGGAYGVWANDSVTNLAPGNYTVRVKCWYKYLYGTDGGSNPSGGEYTITTSIPVTITSTYKNMELTMGNVISSLNCGGAHTGLVPLTVKAKTGSSPFTVTITNGPTGYVGNTYSFTRADAAFNRDFLMNVDELAAGSYTFTVADNCGYTRTINASVGNLTSDPMNGGSLYTDILHHPITTNCNLIYIDESFNISNPSNDVQYYFKDHPSDFFKVGVQLNNGTIEWLSSDSIDSHLIDPGGWACSGFFYELPEKVTEFAANGDKLNIYYGAKDDPDNCKYLVGQINRSYNTASVRYENINCDKFDITFSVGIPNKLVWNWRVHCYPYQWRIIKNDNTTIPGHPWSDWSAPLYDDNNISATDIPYGTKIEFKDADGLTWTYGLFASTPFAGATANTRGCLTFGITDSTFNYGNFGIYYPYFSIPVGTRFVFVSGPKTPIHTDVTTTEVWTSGGSNFNPFSPDYKEKENVYVPYGTYRFKVYLPGEGCEARDVTLKISNYYIAERAAYTTREDCNGLWVYPKKGKIENISYDSVTITHYNVSYKLVNSIPAVGGLDQTYKVVGDSIFLPTTGKYIIGMASNAPYSDGCYAQYDTINYEKTIFGLDEAKTVAHVCVGETVGYIHVAGKGGSGNYQYTLYDKDHLGADSLISTNTTGIFHYGKAGVTYKIILEDLDPACAASTPQNVTLADLNNTPIAYTNSATNTFCLTDSIIMLTINLGAEVEYTWTGDGINSTNEHDRTIGFSPSLLGAGSHTYTVSALPEGCGTLLVKSMTITIWDCSGAKDDSLLVLYNTTGTLDVLYNDRVSAWCQGSMTPNITVAPTNGTAIVNINKEIEYTPTADWTGNDQLTYCITCQGTTTCATAKFYVLEISKNASITNGGYVGNGTIGNPVAVLFSDEIQYTIKAPNLSFSDGGVIVRDTLPAYLNYVSGSGSAGIQTPIIQTIPFPRQDILVWNFASVPAMETKTITYRATPEPGGCAAQPLFINSAYIHLSDTVIATNSTYHQGAGIAIVTFSAMLHGEIYGDEPQAVDFNTAAREGVLVVPDDGYTFVGWSHDGYVSLKGEEIPAQSGIMDYDTLTVYGNVELRANFVRTDEVANENVSDAAVETHGRASNKVWASGQNLYVQVKESGCVIRIYNTEGTLIRQLATVAEGTTTINNLQRGIYIVTVNGQVGNKVRIE